MKLEALDHPKTLDLAARLQVELPTAIGYLELLWAFTGRKSPQGNVGKWADGAIARACHWRGSPDVFVAALRECGFLEVDLVHRLIVHDWHEHAPRWVRAKLKSLNVPFIVATTVATAVDTTVDTVVGEIPTSTRTVVAPSKGSEEKSKKKIAKAICPVERDVGPIERIFEHWKATWNHPRAKLDRKRRRLIDQALKAYTEADLRASISGYLNSSHHCGENEQRTVYDEISLFLRDAAHIDAGITFGQGRHLNGAAKPEVILRSEAEHRAYTAATEQGLHFANQSEWESHYGRQNQTH